MTIVIVPARSGAGRGGPGDASGDGFGKLASTLLAVAVAGAADSQRFRRGKEYAADDSVQRLEISPGVLRATVSGSRNAAYTCVITVPTALRSPDAVGPPDRGEVARLSPQADELLSTCTCPDWEDPCKHAVAALLVFSRELANKPELLVSWRTPSDGGPAPKPGVGSRASGERHLRIVRPAPKPIDPYDTPAWHDFLGEPSADAAAARQAPPPVPDAPPVIGAAVLDRFDIGASISSAIRALRRWGDHDE